MMIDEEIRDDYDLGLKNPLINENDFWKNNRKTIIFLVVLNIILLLIVTLILFFLFKDYKLNFIVLQYDKDFIKPNIKLNAEFQLIKMKNGMIGLLINDPNTNVFQVQFQVENGQLTDTVDGLAHLGEHMIFGGSEKYENYKLIKMLGGTKRFLFNGVTMQTCQDYYFSFFNNFNYEKGIDIVLDAFRYPLYDEKIIIKEIQAINSEFYMNYREKFFILPFIIRQLSSNKTSYKGFGIGNNETLRINESSKISKKLKGYYNVVFRPENIFFILYSNLTINDLEKFVNKHFNYKMHEFSEKEIDINDKKKLQENIKNLKKEEIFDKNLYEHGIYFKSSLNQNTLNIFFHIGKVDYKDIQFDIIEYYDYLFKSKSLLKILKENEYISIKDKIDIYTYLIVENNNVMMLELILTDKGVEELDKVLIIIYNYINIMKKEGCKKDFFYNFVKYKRSLSINLFDKSKMFSDISETFSQIVENYRLYGENQIFATGTPSEKNYNENKIKEYLNNIEYEKSFFAVNIKYNKTITTFLKSTSNEILNYYKADFLLGKIPDNFKERIINEEIDNLKMRVINPYFSEKYEKVIPCYKKSINKCQELNEFDFEKFDEYNGTILEKDKNYALYYQIDKSSESYIAKAYLEINFEEYKLLENIKINSLEFYYLTQKLNEINELDNTIEILRLYSKKIDFKFNCFSDNLEKIFKDFIMLVKEEPEEYQFKYSFNYITSTLNDINETPLRQYTNSIASTFINKGQEYIIDDDTNIQEFYNIKFQDFKTMHNTIFNSITSLTLKIAGNIDKELVQKMNNIMKENISIKKTTKNFETFSKRELISDNPYIINYYQKSNLQNEIDNSILIIYQYDNIYEKYMNIFQGCLSTIGLLSLRSNYSDAYSPSIMAFNNYIYIYEQGRFKEVTQMEDDINEVLLGVISGRIQCENYKDIIKSYELKGEEKEEKNYNSLFNDFIYGKYENNFPNQNAKIDYPDNFSDFIRELSPIFIEPKRYTILISRSDMSDNDFKNLVENKKKIASYILNPNIKIEHTEKIDYLKIREKL